MTAGGRARVTGRALVIGALGAGAARLAWTGLRALPPGGADLWTRKNHRGEPLTLLEGPATAIAVAAAAATAPGVPPRVRAAAVTAAVGAGAFGLVDDLTERGRAKGLRGHVTALRRGELTTGGLKILGIGATGLVAGALAAGSTAGTARRPLRGAADVLVAGALVAGTANLFNLFDLRPGRALKVTLATAPALLAHPAGAVAAAAAGPAIAMLPPDLGEQAMLGDCGANALGAVVGTAAVAACAPPVRVGLLAGVVALTLTSEKFSFTKVIESTPVLRELDALGRRPR